MNLVISQSSNIIVLNQNGDIINVFKDTDTPFKGVCTDNYGNIFVADYESPERVIMLSEDGIFQCTLLTGENNNIYSASPLAIDGCGNLWVCDRETDIKYIPIYNTV